MHDGAYDRYLSTVRGLMEKVSKEEVEAAAALLVETIKNDHLVYVLGTSGHAYMAAEEMFYRAGGLIPVSPIFPSGLALAHGAGRSAIVSRCQGYISKVLAYHALGEGDTLLLVDPEGVSPVAIEAALKAKEMGAKVVAITAREYGKNIPLDSAARHPSGMNLCDLEAVDALIDLKMPADDAVLSFPDCAAKVSPVSTVLYMFILNALVGCTVEQLLALGIEPPVWRSRNVSGASEYNKAKSAEYARRIRKL
jgi:uncharacterized phosphosugar-binding protein